MTSAVRPYFSARCPPPPSRGTECRADVTSVRSVRCVLHGRFKARLRSSRRARRLCRTSRPMSYNRLALEEDYRIGAGESGVHQCPWHRRAWPGRPTLRPGMWCASAVQSCECCAPYSSRRRRAGRPACCGLPGRHRLPLGQLVEDLVAGAAHEVAVHELRQTTRPPFQGVADRRADNGAFGDRRVEQAVVGQQLGETAIHGERAAPVAVLLAVGDQRRVDLEAMQHGLEDRIPEL